MAWSDKDLQNLKNKGLKVVDNHLSKTGEIATIKPKIKIVKRSIEKDTICAILDKYKLTKLIDNYVSELQFDEVRKFRFDWAIPSLKIAIEYEGIMSKKSGHTTINGYTKDLIKYNLATTLGWRILRYNAKNYLDIEKDLIKLINQNEK
jgi:hypothetical protein